MRDCIYRDAAISELRRWNITADRPRTWPNAIDKAVEVVEAIPAVDVRPVVLCKDCMYAPSGTDSGEDQGFALEWPHDEWPEDNPCPCKCGDGWYSRKPKPDFFCANGKREES